MPTMRELFEENVGLAMSRQRDLAEKIGSWDWGLEMGTGTMTFTKKGFLGFGTKRIVTSVQVLGSESEISQTWLWAWANTQSDIPAELLRACESLRARGQREGIAECTEPQLSLDPWDGHRIAMIASGLTPGCAGYYRGPYDGGAIFVLLTGPELVTPVEMPALRFSTLYPEILMQAEITDHRRAARGFARGLGLTVTEERADRWAVTDGRSTLSLDFDEHGRFAGMQGALTK